MANMMFSGSPTRELIAEFDRTTDFHVSHIWHPRDGVLPGYGVSLQDGFQDTFTSTATAALEWGMFPYARGVIDNWLRYYTRDNGMITYRAEMSSR